MLEIFNEGAWINSISFYVLACRVEDLAEVGNVNYVYILCVNDLVKRGYCVLNE